MMNGSTFASASGSEEETPAVGTAFGVFWGGKGVETIWAMAVADLGTTVRVGRRVAVETLDGISVSGVLVEVKVGVWLASLISSF